MTEKMNDLPEIQLNEADKQKFSVLNQSFNLSDISLVLHYGMAAQRKLAVVSDKMLSLTTEKPTLGLANAVNVLIDEIRPFSDIPVKKGLFRKRNIKSLRKRYEAAVTTVEHLTLELENHRNMLLRDHVMLKKLQEAVLEQYKELTMYIEAGRQKLTDIPEENERDRWEKRLYDLELSRTVSLQMIPQIEVLQDANHTLSEKINSLLTNTVPLWKNQMSFLLGLENARGVNDEMIGMLNGVLQDQEEHDRQQTELENKMKELDHER